MYATFRAGYTRAEMMTFGLDNPEGLRSTVGLRSYGYQNPGIPDFSYLMS